MKYVFKFFLYCLVFIYQVCESKGYQYMKEGHPQWIYLDFVSTARFLFKISRGLNTDPQICLNFKLRYARTQN